jgi:hypothetical protein
MIPLFAFRKEDRDQLVAALANLASCPLEAYVVAKLRHGFVPGESMEINRVQKCPVEIEDGGLRHSLPSAARTANFPVPTV